MIMAKNYNVFKISSQPFLPDILSGFLWELGITGITEETDSIHVYTTEGSSINESIIREQMNKLVAEKVIERYVVEKETLEDKNWNEIWEKSREVIRVSDRIIVKPTFKEYKQKADEIVLTIDPKMSFGTGEHQSTQQVLLLLENYVQSGMRVLDVGSGTGILSIAAVKLGAANAVAIDNDKVCYENCIENCELNNVTNEIKVIEGDLNNLSEINFDMVVANIQKNILMVIAEEIKSKTTPGGTVILSGLMSKDEEEILQYYEMIGFNIIEKVIMDEWLAIVFEKE
jgi:ribosomal protein L11 methyltransferase